MAAFASCRRAGWVRFFVVLLCALFVFAILGAPAARAEALTVGLFTAAAVLSAVTAALGFKLSNSAEGQATLAKMVQDFKVSATAVGLVLVGSKINGLIDGVDYIKMQVKAGKTYLDERIVAWVQQWLADKSSVYNSVPFKSGILFNNGNRWNIDKNYIIPISDIPDFYKFFSYPNAPVIYDDSFLFVGTNYNQGFKGGWICFYSHSPASFNASYQPKYDNYQFGSHSKANSIIYVDLQKDGTINPIFTNSPGYNTSDGWLDSDTYHYLYIPFSSSYTGSPLFCNYGTSYGTPNLSGLSGTDTIGKDVVDKSLDEVLAGLKEWAPDWWDAGADSSTNGVVAGAKDLPLNMGSDVKTVTGNPALEVDQPLIYTPWFEQDVGQLRNGETAGTVTNTATSAADAADKAEAAQGTVEDAQGVVQSIISWGLDYISPDKGLFSRFPLCIPYDAYLLVTAALGVDAQDLGDIVGQSPGQLSAQVDDGVAVQSDFVPVISVKHDWTQDGVTTPVEVTIDLRPYDAIIKMIRTLVSVYVIAELIASEYKRIRGA